MSSVENKPVVHVLTMGGTIAGVAESAVSASYQAGARPGADLLASIPGLENLADVHVQDVVAKDSSDLELFDWTQLLHAVEKAVQREQVAGVVITHGTDTMEETAFFLSLLLRSDKPVILVGAMRPATALSADGPLNLYNAIAVAVDPASRCRGVQIVMNDRIMPARRVTKGHTTAVESFAMPGHGGFGAGAGTVTMGLVKYFETPCTQGLPEDIQLTWPSSEGTVTYPRVDILYQHVGMMVPEIEQFLGGGPNLLRGLVIAGTGAGNVAACLKPLIDGLRAKDVVIVRSTRVWAGGVIDDYQHLDSEWGLVGAGELSAHKARTLLMLLLRQGYGLDDVRRCFKRF